MDGFDDFVALVGLARATILVSHFLSHRTARRPALRFPRLDTSVPVSPAHRMNTVTSKSTLNVGNRKASKCSICLFWSTFQHCTTVYVTFDFINLLLACPVMSSVRWAKYEVRSRGKGTEQGVLCRCQHCVFPPPLWALSSPLGNPAWLE